MKTKRVLINIVCFIILLAVTNLVLFMISYSILGLLVDYSVVQLTAKSLIVTFSIPFVVSLCFAIILFVSINKNNKVSKFISTNYSSFIAVLVLSSIFLFVLSRVKDVDLEKSENLIGIEWAVFGVSAALFLYRIEKHKEFVLKMSTTSLDAKFGDSLYEEVAQINEFYDDMSDTTLTIIYLILNSLFLIFFTAGIYFLDTDKNTIIVSYLYLFSLFFTTNTFVQTITHIFISYFRSRKMIKNKYSVDYLEKAKFQSLIESHLYKNFKEEVEKDPNLTDEEKQEKLNSFVNHCLSKRKEMKYMDEDNKNNKNL